MHKNKYHNNFLTNLSPENRLLLLCIQTETAGREFNDIRNILSGPFDWEECMESAAWQGIRPLLYKKLRSIQDSVEIPEHVMDLLKSEYKANLARNMFMHAQLKSVIDVLHTKGVDVIVLKGAALASTVYSDIGMRPMSDIDLLIRKHDLHSAERIMSGLGYLFRDSMTPEWHREHNHHIRYNHNDRNIPVEIHWDISSDDHPSLIQSADNEMINQWWENARMVELVHTRALVLSPEDLLIHLSLHFLKHRFLSAEGVFNDGFTSKGALIQLCDILQVLKYYEDNIKWDRLQREAKEYRLEKILYSTLYIVKELMGDNFVLRSKFNSFDSGSVNVDIINILLKKIFIKEDSSEVSSFLIQSFGENTFQNSIKKIFKTMFPPPEIISGRYSVPVSSIKLYFYYLMRPFDVLFRHRITTSDVPRIKEDAVLTRWICTKDSVSDAKN